MDKPVKEIGIDDMSFKNDQKLLKSINKIKSELMEQLEIKMQEFNDMKIAFGTKSDIKKALTYLYNYAHWDAKDIVHLETTYNSFNELYKNAKNNEEMISVDYVDVDWLYKYLEKEKSTEDVRTRGVRGATFPIVECDEKGNFIMDGNTPKIEATCSFGYLKMLVSRANQETTIPRLEFQSISDQVKMCDTYLQQISIGQKTSKSINVELKRIKDKYDKFIELENEKSNK